MVLDLMCQGFTFCDHVPRNTDVSSFLGFKVSMILVMEAIPCFVIGGCQGFFFVCLGERRCRVLLIDQDGLILIAVC